MGRDPRRKLRVKNIERERECVGTGETSAKNLKKNLFIVLEGGNNRTSNSGWWLAPRLWKGNGTRKIKEINKNNRCARNLHAKSKMIFSGFVVGIVIINEIQRMTGWHAESSKQIAWENYKRKMRVGVGEIVRSENGFRCWVLRARGVLDKKRQVCWRGKTASGLA